MELYASHDYVHIETASLAETAVKVFVPCYDCVEMANMAETAVKVML